MQSLKSTAFAVTLLAISFGLYCVTSTKPKPTTDFVDPIQIDSQFATTRNYSTPNNQFSSSPMSLPVADVNTLPAPLQVSTGAGYRNLEVPNISAPQLPALLGPPAAAPSHQAPESPTLTLGNNSLKLPSISTPELPESIQLPEITTRQPVSTSAATRDEGLINALSDELKNPSGGSFQLPNIGPSTDSDDSYNSLATALGGERDAAVSRADGSFDTDGSGTVEAAPSSAQRESASIAAVWEEVDQLVAADEYRKALGTLSQHYGRKGLTGPQQQKLQGWLDALAGKVIYSTEHHFVRQPYVVQPGETLASISQHLKIPAEVIYNINRAQFTNGNEVSSGMELKVINGPFHAEVNLETKSMTLFVKNLYAGRFPVSVGISGKPDAGNFRVMVKSPNGYTWRDANGKEYPAGTSGNGYGPYWIGLTGSLCIHAVEENTPQGHRGCIGLNENDAKDVFGILSKESQISIVR